MIRYGVKTILITGASRVKSHHLREIESVGSEVVFMQHESAEMPVDPATVEVVMCNSLFEHHSESHFHRLKFVQATSAGLDRFPLKSLAARGVKVEPARGVYSPAIAEFALLLILQILKKSSAMFAHQRQHRWKKERDLKELTGLTACVIGYGSIGKEIASRLKPFKVKVIPLTRQTLPEERDRVLSTADIVILSAPLTEETFHLMNTRTLSLMKKDSVLINISRGQLIDESALIHLLDAGHFYGVGLDVFETEPLDPSSPLWDYERVIISPHNSFVSDKSADRLTSLFLKNLGEML